MKILPDTAVVITGAASGIGRALALEMGARSARLLLADLDAAGLQQVSSALQAQGVVCYTLTTDTGDEAAVAALAAETQRLFGAADIVVNNAGVSLSTSVEQLQSADAHWLMNINFWGVVHGCRHFLPQLRSRPQALLVNISSIFAMLSMPTQSMYNASKAAVRAFSDALREELRGSQVGVLCVHPGGIQTRIADNARMLDIALVATNPAEMRSNFNSSARTSAQDAARAIVRAIESDQSRLLIGLDARLGDWLYRLAPSRSSNWLTRLVQWQRRRRAQDTA